MNSKTPRRVVAGLLLISVTACTSMQPVAQPREFMQMRRPPVVWVSQGTEIGMMAVESPKLEGDSLVGFVEGEYTEIAMNSVKSMQAKQYSRKTTALFAVGVSAVLATLLFVVKGGSGSGQDMTGEEDIGIIRH